MAPGVTLYNGYVVATLAILDSTWVLPRMDGFTEDFNCTRSYLRGYIDVFFSSGTGGVVSLDQGCDGNAISIQPGEEFWIYASLAALAYRGSSWDAINTLSVDFGQTVDARLRAELRETLVVQPGIPEPATWALMLAGLGLAGARLRRRRTHVSAVDLA
jgi:hypothetical protein